MMLCCNMHIDVDVGTPSNIIDMSVSAVTGDGINVDLDCGIGSKLPFYDGAYEVTPKTYPQELATKNKSMSENISVLSIPYNEVHNNTGLTVTIG